MTTETERIEREQHDPTCEGCKHHCPWDQNPMGAPYCSICDDHFEALPDDDERVLFVASLSKNA